MERKSSIIRSVRQSKVGTLARNDVCALNDYVTGIYRVFLGSSPPLCRNNLNILRGFGCGSISRLGGSLSCRSLLVGRLFVDRNLNSAALFCS
jgi:hypothetical protein